MSAVDRLAESATDVLRAAQRWYDAVAEEARVTVGSWDTTPEEKLTALGRQIGAFQELRDAFMQWDESKMDAILAQVDKIRSEQS